MAHRALIKGVILEKLWRTSVYRTSYLSRQKFQKPISSWRCMCTIISNIRFFCSERPTINHQVNCSRDENLLSSSSVVAENSHQPPQEVDLRFISDNSKTEGRVGQTTNMVFGDTVIDGSTGEWLTLIQKANTYPSVRRFTAIGLGGDDFVQSMIAAVESVIQHPIPQGDVKQRVSSGGKYVSVNIGPVQVISREQVRAIYNAMRADKRMKFFL